MDPETLCIYATGCVVLLTLFTVLSVSCAEPQLMLTLGLKIPVLPAAV